MLKYLGKIVNDQDVFRYRKIQILQGENKIIDFMIICNNGF